LSLDVITQLAFYQRFTKSHELASSGTRFAKSPAGLGVLDQWEVTVFEIRKARRGFASMSAEKQREIASKGGRAAHAKGTAHEWSAEEARRAGRKGGQASRGGRGKLPSVA